MNLHDAEILAKTLISEFLPEYGFGWMDEKTVNGRCYYGPRLIKLSRPLTKLRTPEAVGKTIMHEIAHGLTPGSGHGEAWQLQMIKFRLSPDRCSQDEVDRSSIANWEAVCKGCGTKFHMFRKPRVRKACKSCWKTTNYELTWYRI